MPMHTAGNTYTNHSGGLPTYKPTSPICSEFTLALNIHAPCTCKYWSGRCNYDLVIIRVLLFNRRNYHSLYKVQGVINPILRVINTAIRTSLILNRWTIRISILPLIWLYDINCIDFKRQMTLRRKSDQEARFRFKGWWQSCSYKLSTTNTGPLEKD